MPAKPTSPRGSHPAPEPASLDTILAARAELKRRDPDVILLFRVEDQGDYYRAYGDDVRTLLRGLGYQGIGGTCSIHDRPGDFVSIPANGLDWLLARIVAAGKRAAVCEQVKDPVKATNGARVERIVSEGKIDATEALLDACRAFLARYDELREQWGDEGFTRSLAARVRAAVDLAEKGSPGPHVTP